MKLYQIFIFNQRCILLLNKMFIESKLIQAEKQICDFIRHPKICGAFCSWAYNCKVTSHVTYLCNIKTSFSVDDIRSQDQCVSIGGEPSS